LPRSRILIVEDDPGVRFGIREFLAAKGYETEEAASCEEALEAFRAAPPDVVVTDYRLPDANALQLLPRLKAIDDGVPVVILTGHASIDLAVKAIKEGAEQFLTKPVELPSLLVVLERLLEGRRNRRKQAAVRPRRGEIDPFLGTSAAIRSLAEEARRALGTESPVLIQGETGSGKGVLARWLHQNSARREEPFVDLNCAALSRELLESELFGHEKGAFTGAVAAKQGLLEVAHRGSVFLDEIGDMDPAIQPKLLKVLEEKRFRRVGDVRDRQVDVRLIAATHQDLGTLVRERRFRSDLYFRVTTIPLRVPPLRERPEDILPLGEQLLGGLAEDLGRPGARLAEDARRALLAYSWPGNVRELRNVLERGLLLADGGSITRAVLRFDLALDAEPDTDQTQLTLAEVERRHIERVVRQEGGHVGRAAARLGVPRSSLYQRLKKLGLDTKG